MTRNAIKYYAQMFLVLGLLLAAVLSVLPVSAILFYYAIGSIETKEFDEAVYTLIAYLWAVVPGTAVIIWSKRKEFLRQGITADFLGGLSWSERKEFWRKQDIRDE